MPRISAVRITNMEDQLCLARMGSDNGQYVASQYDIHLILVYVHACEVVARK